MQTDALRCNDVVREAMVERYLARTLSSSETEAFESHFIACERCQRAIELGAAMHRSFRELSDTTTPASVMATSRASRWGRAAGAIAAVLVVAVAIVRWPSTPSPLSSLGDVTEPPVYLGVPVRAGMPATSDSLFSTAMEHYEADRYEDAARALTDAIKAGADLPPAHFFRGAALLMNGQPRDAVAAFGRVIDGNDSPYRAEAHFYRAKGLLQLGEREQAVRDLDAIAAETSDIGAQARALRDSVERTIVR